MISVSQFAERFGLSERTVRNYCKEGKLHGAVLVGKVWSIPDDAMPPRKGKAKQTSPLLKALREEKKARLKGGIYHRTQIDMTYNSNHIEGSKLTHEMTRMIFETHTLGVEAGQTINVDDILETVNHFRCMDYIIDHAEERLSGPMIKLLHRMLKTGTSDAQKEWFRVGEYKLLANEVGDISTSDPKDVGKDMQELLHDYWNIKEVTVEDIIAFHHRFECIHPFQDGNGTAYHVQGMPGAWYRAIHHHRRPAPVLLPRPAGMEPHQRLSSRHLPHGPRLLQGYDGLLQNKILISVASVIIWHTHFLSLQLKSNKH